MEWCYNTLVDIIISKGINNDIAVSIADEAKIKIFDKLSIMHNNIVSVKNKKIELSAKVIESKESEIKKCEEVIKNKDDEIQQQSNEIKKCEEVIKNKDDEIKQMDDEIKQMDDEIKQRGEEILIMKQQMVNKIDVDDIENNDEYVEDIKRINRMINVDYNDSVMKALLDESFKEECINSIAMKNQYSDLVLILKRHFDDNDKINSAAREYCMLYINSGVIASIRGARLNGIVNAIITNIPELQSERFVIKFENFSGIVNTPERPDFVISDKESGKDIIGYTQVDIWSSEKYRGDKYLTYQPSDNVNILCVVSKKCVINYRRSTKMKRNYKYEVFKYGYDKGVLCYANSLRDNICRIFGVVKQDNDINIEEIVNGVVGRRVMNRQVINSDKISKTFYGYEEYCNEIKYLEDKNNGIKVKKERSEAECNEWKCVKTWSECDMFIYRKGTNIGVVKLHNDIKDIKCNINNSTFRFIKVKDGYAIEDVFNKMSERLSEYRGMKVIGIGDIIKSYCKTI